MKIMLIAAILLILLVVLAGCKSPITGSITIDTTKKAAGTTFQATGNEICTEDGKPVIRLFATSWCPHCRWIKETYMNVAQEYVDRGEIIAHLWEVDTNDNLMTKSKESAVPESERKLFKQANSDESVPTFVFGCKYVRVGNAYEAQNNLAAEETEFRAVIDKLLQEVKT